MEKEEGNILIVDDDYSILNSLKIFLQYEFHHVFTLKNPQQIPEILKKEDIDIILLDMNFTPGKNNGTEGIFWLRNILKQDPQAVVIMITAFGNVDLAIKAIKEGAVDFIMKPWDNEKMISTLRSAYQLKQSKKTIRMLQNRQTHLHEELNRDYTVFLGQSPAIKKVTETVRKIAATDANVLILGENGTGKELIARELHRHSGRRNEIFISVDMGSLHENLIESELFGHVKGAFTDAGTDRTGRFETASGGSLFLDEIGNLSLPLQSKLLNALQNRCITPIGSNRIIPIDIRLICATNQDLHNMITNGTFREDLYYRINTIELRLPPLRERKEDILILARHFLKQFASKYGKPLPRITRKAADQLIMHDWPGNVRELKHTMEKAVILNDSGVLLPEELIGKNPLNKNTGSYHPMTLEEIEKEGIRRALKRNQGNMSRTARELQIARQTLYNKMRKFGL
ncbi:MAG TPA: sigma-54-dependent Fis family transcriptional regulator [Bacteroidetes bacterium]|nr:sigma-54-dependent Fis family transcriptional regulator [Bacteroidota bacterium]